MPCCVYVKLIARLLDSPRSFLFPLKHSLQTASFTLKEWHACAVTYSVMKNTLTSLGSRFTLNGTACLVRRNSLVLLIVSYRSVRTAPLKCISTAAERWYRHRKLHTNWFATTSRCEFGLRLQVTVWFFLLVVCVRCSSWRVQPISQSLFIWDQFAAQGALPTSTILFSTRSAHTTAKFRHTRCEHCVWFVGSTWLRRKH